MHIHIAHTYTYPTDRTRARCLLEIMLLAPRANTWQAERVVAQREDPANQVGPSFDQRGSTC